MTIKAKSVLTAWVHKSSTPIDADPHVEEPGADLWTPPGDITIIGAQVWAGFNPHPNTSMDITGGLYIYADLSLIAKRDEAAIVVVHMASDPLELPTAGEYGSMFGNRMEIDRVMFPVGYGIDTDKWHPVYLNYGYRGFWGATGNFEVFAGGLIYFVEA